ncbi:MAG: DUF1838 family protein [Gammaproteobacteria bacterium]|nr:DUF1838 family protein [Gammaproteobacteria bacterium]
MSIINNPSTRREILIGAAGLALYATLPGDVAAAAQRSFVPDFADPTEALRAHVKLVGSLAKESVISFYRLNIYADLNEGNFVPLFTLNNLLIDNWTPQGNDSYQMLKYEAGYYTAIDSYEPIKTFKHPLSGKAVPVQNFRLGPVPRGYDKDKYTVMGYNPNPLPLEVIGDRVFLATQSIESHPSFTDPKKTQYTNSFMTYSATLADMQNPNLPSAPVHAQLQNKNEWAPWMEMDNHPGGTVVRGYGTKVSGLDDLPPGVLEQFGKQMPQILDTENWKGFVSEANPPN